MTIDSETSPDLEAVAQPDGYVEATENVSPVRRWVSGAWRDLDLTLKVAADGTVRPGLAMGDLAISNGGPAGSMIASYSSDGFSYAVKSPFALPEPTLLNDSAVFTDVIPGVDLVVRAHEVGYSYDWVVKTAEAAADPRVTELTVPVDAPGLSPHPRDGGIWYDDAGGVHRAWMPAPMMWDSSGADSDQTSSPSPSSAQLSRSAAGATASSSSGTDSGPEDSVAAVEAGPAGGQSATVGVTATSHDLQLVPDAGLLANAELPVVIDPEEVGYQNPSASLDGWTAVWDNYPSKSFWKTSHSLGAGYEGYEQYKVVRSYFRFRTAFLGGKHIIAAHLHLKQIWDASCSARVTDVYRTHQATTNTTWSNQPGRLGLQDSSSSTAGCDGTAGSVQLDVTPAVTSVADNLDSTASFMVRAHDEGDKTAWKQFADAGASLTLAYVSKPQTPGLSSLSLTTSNSAHVCTNATSGSTALPLGSNNLTFGAKLASGDGANADLHGVFELVNTGTGNPDTRTSAMVTSGQTAKIADWTVGDKYVYRFAVRNRATWTFHGTDGHLDSAASSSCYFKVDTTRPSSPTVTSTAFTLCQTKDVDDDSCAVTGIVGTQGKVTITGSSDTVSLSWVFDGVADKADNTRTATPTLKPTRVFNELRVTGTDQAGNPSEERVYHFKVDHLSADDQWGFETDASTGVAGTGGGTQNTGQDTTKLLTLAGASLTGRGRVGAHAECVPGWAGHECNGLHATGTSGSRATSTDTAVSTAGDFTVSFWAHLNADTAGTVVAATSASGDPFEIGYDPSNKAWVAGRRAAGATSITGVSADGTAVVGAWTHVTVTYTNADPARTVTIFIAGVKQKAVALSTAGTANTGWWLGCGSDNGTAATRCADADIDGVELYKSSFDSDMVAELVAPTSPRDPGNRRYQTASAARWSMGTDPDPDDPDAVVGANGPLESTFGADLTTNDQVTFGPSQVIDGNGFSVMTLPGTADQSAQVSHQVVDASVSFTVTARVAVTDPSKSGVIAQQTGADPGGSGVDWTLAYRALGSDPPDDLGNVTYHGEFVFQRRTGKSDGSPSVVEVRTGSQTIEPNDFKEIAGVYDAEDHELQFFLPNTLVDQTEMDDPEPSGTASFATPWRSRGVLKLGNGTLSDALGANGAAAPLAGMIDDVQIFSGALVDTAATDYLGVLQDKSTGTAGAL